MHAEEAQKIFAHEKPAKIEEFDDYDGYLFAFPTRFGVVPAQFKAFLDATGQSWSKGAMENKPVAMMTSSANELAGARAQGKRVAELAEGLRK